MGLFGSPNVERINAKGDFEALVRAANYRKDAAVREAAVAALTAHQEELIRRLDTKNVAHLKIAREALVLIGAPARERLIFILEEGHVHRRQDAAFVLGEMRDASAAAPLMRALRHTDPLLRMLAAQALGKIGDPAAVNALRLASNDTDSRVSGEARKAYKHITAPRA